MTDKWERFREAVNRLTECWETKPCGEMAEELEARMNRIGANHERYKRDFPEFCSSR